MTMAERMSAAMCELQLTLGNVGSAGAVYLGFVPPLADAAGAIVVSLAGR